MEYAESANSDVQLAVYKAAGKYKADTKRNLLEKFLSLAAKRSMSDQSQQAFVKTMMADYSRNEIIDVVTYTKIANPYVQLSVFQAAAEHREVTPAYRMLYAENYFTLAPTVGMPAFDQKMFAGKINAALLRPQARLGKTDEEISDINAYIIKNNKRRDAFEDAELAELNESASSEKPVQGVTARSENLLKRSPEEPSAIESPQKKLKSGTEASSPDSRKRQTAPSPEGKVQTPEPPAPLRRSLRLNPSETPEALKSKPRRSKRFAEEPLNTPQLLKKARGNQPHESTRHGRGGRPT